MINTQRNKIVVVFLTILLSFRWCTEALHARSKDLGPLLEPIRKKYDVPAMAAAVIFNGHTVAWGATGLRKMDSDVKVTRDDQFHIGSCTKAMTATLVGILVEHGKLRWDMTLAEALPDMADDMHTDYRNVTLKHLLAHRAGMVKRYPKGTTFRSLHDLPGSPTQQRFAYARMVLREPPLAKPGTKYIYSNAAYAIAGLICERAMNSPWETLMREMLFEPLGMKTAGFGAMGSPGKIDQPWQHRVVDGKICPIEPGPLSDDPPATSPAGAVHCSIKDWASFITTHLRGTSEGERFLKSKTLQVLHTPVFGGDYALGWQVTERKWAQGKALTHQGSNKQNYAVVWIALKRNFAVLVATNQAKDGAKACEKAAWALIQKFLLDEKKEK